MCIRDSIRGYAVEGEAAKQVTEAFAAKQNSCGGFLFAVGDGNQSLATAKTFWENIKKSGKFTEEQLKTHPARHALVEICNPVSYTHLDVYKRQAHILK